MFLLSQRLVLSDRVVEFGRREVIIGAETHRLSPLEAATLAYLAARPYEPVSREELLREVWGYGAQVNSRAADITVSRLRRRVEQDARRPRHLLTVRGVGYRFIPAASAASSDAVMPSIIQPVRSVRPLPRPLNVLLGRQQALARLQEAPSRLMVVSGMPGVGKTRLVLEHGLWRRERGEPVWWCPLDAVDTLDAFVESVSRALGVVLPPSGEGGAQLGRFLAEKGSGTLILDTFEHLPLACGLVLQSWLQQAPALRTVLTSRRRLGLQGAWLLRLHPLPPDVAAALLLARAQQVGASELSPTEAAQIAQALDGNPLSIELVAARLTLFAPEQLLTRLAQPLTLLRAVSPQDRRHGSLEASLSWSVNLLSPVERMALVCLARDAGPLTIPEAETRLLHAGISEPLQRISTLIDHALLQVDGSRATRRIRMMHGLRQLVSRPAQQN